MTRFSNAEVRSPTKILLIALAVVGSIALTSCDPQSDRPESLVPVERAIAPQLDALEKAENVEDKLQDEVNKRDDAMRDQGI